MAFESRASPSWCTRTVINGLMRKSAVVLQDVVVAHVELLFKGLCYSFGSW